MIKHNKKLYLHLIGLFVIICVHVVVFLKPFEKSDCDEYEEDSTEKIEPWVEYLQDSTYKVVIDTLITVYDAKTENIIKSYSLPSGSIKSLAIHPSGSHLLIMQDDSLLVFDLKKDVSLVDVKGMDEIYFSSDGRYLMTIYYRESKVELYQWPSLEFLTCEYMGLGWNRFWWRSQSGKLIFYYEENNYTYRTGFPSIINEDYPSFSVPECIDSIKVN